MAGILESLEEPMLKEPKPCWTATNPIFDVEMKQMDSRFSRRHLQRTSSINAKQVRSKRVPARKGERRMYRVDNVY